MTKTIIENIDKIEDLLLFSSAYKKGLIKLNISKLAKEFEVELSYNNSYNNVQADNRLI